MTGGIDNKTGGTATATRQHINFEELDNYCCHDNH